MAELRYTYLLDVKDRASRAVTTANERIARSAATANRALEKQGAVAQSASRQVQSAGARQAAEWKQVARTAQVAERQVAQSATQASTQVTRAVERQVAAQRKAGASYSQIARQQKAAGVSARETAAAIEQSAAREQKAMTQSAGAARKHSGALGGLTSRLKGFGGMAAGLGATLAAFKGYQFIKDSVDDVTSLARQTVKLTAITKMDATTASSWLQIAKERGISAQQLSRGFVTLEKNQTKAAAGSKTQAEAFRSLGISQDQLKRSSPEQLILRVADAMKNMENPSKRAAAAQALFGRAGVSLIATLSGGSQAIQDHMKVVQEYGASLDKNGVKQAMKLVAEQRKLKLAMDGVKISIGMALVPILARGAKALATFVLQMRQGTGAGGQVRRAFEQMADGAKSVWSAIGPAVKALATFARQHPGLVKVAGGIVAIGVGLRALRFASAISGATTLLGVLGKLGKVSMGGSAAGAGAGVGAGRLATYAALTSRIGALVIASLAARKGLTDLTAQANKSHSGVARVLGKVGEFVHTVGWKPIEAAAGRLKRTFDQLSGITPKLAQVSQRTTERLQQILGRSQGLNLAKTFAAEANSAGHATAGMVNRIVAQLGRLKGDARVEARKAIDGMLAQMVRGGTLTASAAAKLRRGITGAFGPLKDDLGSAARRGIRAITREFGALPGGITNPLRLSLAQTRTYMGRIINVVNVTTAQLRTMRALLAQGIEPTSPRSIGGGHRPATGSHGGILGRRGFRRYQAGGVVPAMVSPGEMIVHQGRAGMVPGAPVAADNVAMMLPVGAAVLTGDGQRMVAQGATIGQAIARQAPHYATGGWVRTGATVYNDPPPGAFGSLAGGYAELGTATRSGAGTGRGYIARALGLKGELPANFALDVKIHGRTRRLRKRDRGYGQGTPAYSIDIWRDSWPAFGINSSFKGPALIRPASGSASAPAAGGSRQAVSYSPRGRLITSGRAMQLGYQAGLEGGSLYGVYSSVRDAVTYNRTVRTIPSGGGGGGGGRAPRRSGRGPLVSARRPIGDTWSWARALASKFGLRISSNYRTPAHNRAVGGVPNSWHTRGSARRPEAFDFVPPSAAALRWVRGHTRPAEALIHNAGSGLHLHVGGLYRRGGIIGGVQRFQGGGRPVAIGRPVLQPTAGGVVGLSGATMTAYQRTLNMIRQGQEQLLKAGAHANEQIAAGLHLVDQAIQRVHQVSYGRLEKMAKSLKSAIATTKDPDVARRLKAELRLVFGEMGRRIGLLAKEAADMADPAVRAAVHVERILKASKGRIDMTTGAALSKLEKSTQVGEDQLRAAIAKLQDAYRRAQKAGLKGAMHGLAGRIADLMGQLTQAMRDARTAFAASLTDIASSRVSLAQTGLQRVELEQRLAGTYDTGGRARADYITQSVIPQLQAERDQIRAQGVEAMRQNNAELARAMRQAWEEKGNDILQALLDVKDATETTASNTDPLKSLGGQLAFEFGGSRLTDDLLASSVGA